ncbi:MAG TPA: hypothetical protein VKA68_11315 [bacterium]|nr:hypothetical protein [bacterium]
MCPTQDLLIIISAFVADHSPDYPPHKSGPVIHRPGNGSHMTAQLIVHMYGLDGKQEQ